MKHTTRRALVALAAATICAPTAFALQEVPPGGLPTASMYGSAVLPELDGVVSWKTLATVEPVKQSGKIVNQFGPGILALDGKQVRLQGFMMPMDIGKSQRHFLISAAPPSCPFCLPAGPEAVVEVFAVKPVTYSPEPIFMTGQFSLVKTDPSGLLYRLSDASEFKVR